MERMGLGHGKSNDPDHLEVATRSSVSCPIKGFARWNSKLPHRRHGHPQAKFFRKPCRTCSILQPS